MRCLLHISDVHFGPKHLPHRSDAILGLVERRRPDLVALSGDLTQRAKPRQFRQAREFVDRLAVPAVVVPGNHDVPLYRVWERLFVPFGAYRKHFSPDLEPSWEDEELYVAGVNTAHNWTLTGGRILLSRLEELSEELEEAPEGKTKIVVAHHHLIPPPRFGTQAVLGNAYEAVRSFSDSGVELVLSGHQHQSFFATSEEFYPSGRAPVIVLHAGTTTSTRGRGVEADTNSFNWIQVDDDAIRVSHFRWDTEADDFVEGSRHWFPRRHCHPYAIRPSVFS
ncbi:MAG: metallophosphoesterase family protein [Thermoanaerobaculia bacterium]|nr:metallophosphoesterase family protein [Thermoanaerobaculia bacterium]